jgi:tetratricopeptide (TPR) repeat protein
VTGDHRMVWTERFLRGLAIDKQSFGPDHPRVATHLNNLATLLKATGRLKEAEPLYRLALAIDERSFGWDHPNVGTDLNNLAAVLESTNRLEEAEQLMQLMLGIFLRSSATSGREHPFLGATTRNYTALLAEMGRSSAQILARLNELARRFGVGSFSELPFQSHEKQLLRSRAASRPLNRISIYRFERWKKPVVRRSSARRSPPRAASGLSFSVCLIRFELATRSSSGDSTA